LLLTAITLGMMALWLIWAGLRLFHSHRGLEEQPASITVQSPAQPAVSPPAAAANPTATLAALPTVLHQEIPDVSHSARESIRGVIKVAVRVTVDRSGNVVAATLDGRGSSKYFARAATEAAKKWKFAPAADQASRLWLLRFEFTRAGTTGQAAAQRP